MGIFGGAAPTPVIRAPIKEDEKPKTTTLDPNHGEAVAKARRKRLALKKRGSRSNLRVRLSTPNTTGRQGIRI